MALIAASKTQCSKEALFLASNDNLLSLVTSSYDWASEALNLVALLSILESGTLNLVHLVLHLGKPTF